MKTEDRGLTKLVRVIVYISTGLLLISAGAYIYSPQRWQLIPAGLGILGFIFSAIKLRERVLEILRLRSTIYGTNTIAMILIVLAIIVLLNLIAYRHPGRLDLTGEGVYSLSDQTVSVLKNLKNEVKVIAFLPDSGSVRNSAEDLLKGYRYKSPKFSYEFVDPTVHPDVTEKYNITSENTLIVISKDNQTKVTDITENALTNAIIKVTREGKKKIYFTEGHGERSIEDNQTSDGFYSAAQALRDLNYEVYSVNLSTKPSVPEDASVLIIADPRKPFLSSEIEIIEKYLKKGGRAVALIDQSLRPGQVEDGALLKLLNSYGVYPGEDIIIERELRLFAGPTLGIEPIVKNFIKHSITEPLKGPLMLSIARTIDFKSTEGVDGTVLAKTSEGSWAETNLELLRNKRQVEEDAKDRKGPVPVAVAVTKKIEGDENKGKEMRMVVIGDADFANNRMINNLYNIDFFLNSVNWLAEESDLISIAPKQKKTSRIFLSAQQKRWLKTSVIMIPALFIILGAVVWWRRRTL